MGPDASHEEGFGRIQQQGDLQADGEAIAGIPGWRVVLPPSGGCDGGGGLVVAGDLRILPPEHGHTVYCK